MRPYLPWEPAEDIMWGLLYSLVCVAAGSRFGSGLWCISRITPRSSHKSPGYYQTQALARSIMWELQGRNFLDLDLENSWKFVSAWPLLPITFPLHINSHLNPTWLIVLCGIFCKSVFCAQTLLVKNNKSTHALFCIPSEQMSVDCCWSESNLSHNCAVTQTVTIKSTVLALREFVALREWRKPILCQSQKLQEHSTQLWLLGWHGLFQGLLQLNEES